MISKLVDLTMHAALSVPGKLKTKLQSNKSVREEQEERLYSPHGSSHFQKTKVLLKGYQSNFVRLVGEPNPVVLTETNCIKTFLSEELYYLINGFSKSEIVTSLKKEIQEKLQENYQDMSENDMMQLRLQSLQSNSLSLPSVASRDPSIIIQGLTSYVESIFNPTNVRSGANHWDQFVVISSRTFKNLYRNPELLQTHYVISVAASFVCGFLYWKVDDTLAGFQNRLGVFFFICALFGFGCLSSMQAFASERALFKKERANRYYSPASYFVSKILFDTIPLRVVPPIILGLICYHMIGLQADIILLLRFLLVLVLFNVTSACCCLAISIVFQDPGVATLLAILIMLFEMLFGGLLLNKNTLTPAFQWMHRLSFFNYAFEALVVNEVAGLTLYEEKFGFKIDVYFPH